MKKVFFIILLVTGKFLITAAQEVVLEENPLADTVEQTWGMNLQHYIHTYLRWDFMVGPNDPGASYKPGSSAFDFGMRYKYKISGFYSIGGDFDFLSFANYYLQQNSLSEQINDSVGNYKSERLIFTGFGLEFFNRFNYGRRGNSIGKFIDIGLYGNYSYYVSHYISDDIDDKPYGVIELTQRKLKYTERLSYGISGRIGFNRWVVDVRYRLSDRFKEYTGWDKLPELPRFQIGLEIGLF